MNRAPGRRLARRGFTLLEVLIVLGVILTLASLVLGIGSAVIRSAERAQLESTMEIVDKCFSEWESTVGRPVSFVGRVGTGRGDPFITTAQGLERFDVREGDIAGGTAVPPGLSVAGQAIARAQGAGVYAVNLLGQIDFTKELLATATPSLLRPEPTTTNWPPVITGYRPSFKNPPASPRSEFVDPWGKRLAFVFPGRQFRWGVDTGLPDDDGTVRTSTELVLGSCAGRRICLVSAGPDGVFGPEAATAALRASAPADNVVLYPLLPPNGN